MNFELNSKELYLSLKKGIRLSIVLCSRPQAENGKLGSFTWSVLPRGGGGGTPHMKGVGMLPQKF